MDEIQNPSVESTEEVVTPEAVEETESTPVA